MNKIWTLMWFDEDAYGPTRRITIMVQAENIETAIEMSEIYIESNYKITQEMLSKYEKFEIKDISDDKILNSYIGSF